MKKTIGVMIVAAAVGIAIGGFAAAEKKAPKPKKGMVVGEVVDIVSLAMKGFSGVEHAESGQNRASQGFPIGILEEDSGDIFICAYKNPAPASSLQPANNILSPYMGKKVVVQGLKYKTHGTNVIRIAIVSEY